MYKEVHVFFLKKLYLRNTTKMYKKNLFIFQPMKHPKTTIDFLKIDF